METRQAYFRNMRSKCRCSCVLQFTRHHRVSSVLHRPPSQMIHCIVLYLDSQTWRSSDSAASHRFNQKTASHPFKGEIENPMGGESSLNCSPRLCPPGARQPGGHPFPDQRATVPPHQAVQAQATDKLSVARHETWQVGAGRHRPLEQAGVSRPSPEVLTSLSDVKSD